jgi:outer membrane protein assembly factor BamB
MSTTSDNDKSATSHAAPKKAYFPWVVVIVVAAMLIALNFFDELLAEAVNLDPGVRNLATFMLPLVALTLVGAWFLIFRARSCGSVILSILATLSPVFFFLLYQPVFGGNANLERFEPRFWGGGAKIVTKEAESKLSRLATTTVYDFPQFLGPDRNGVIGNVNLAPWKDSPPELLWKQPVGNAWSGFAVVNGYAITQEQRDDNECVVCYEIETGDTVWVHSAQRRHEDFSSFGRVGPRATPSIHNGKVYTVGGTGIIECLDGSDGSLLWTFDLPSSCGIEQVPSANSKGLAFTQENSTLTWGRSQSPLIIDDLMIVAGGGIAKPAKEGAEVPDMRVESPGATLVAINIETGEEAWRNGDRSIAYGSPILANVAGVPQILLVVEDHCVSHDPKSGEELWSWSWPGGSNGAANCSQVTILDDKTIMLTKGYATGAQILSIENDEGKLIPVPEARDPRVQKTKFSNPVIHNGHSYAISDRFLECVEAKTLKKKWRRRGFGTGQLMLVGDKLLVHAETGRLFLVEASPEEYSELGAIDTVDGTCWNTLAIFKDLVLVRSEKEAACFRIPISQ